MINLKNPTELVTSFVGVAAAVCAGYIIGQNQIVGCTHPSEQTAFKVAQDFVEGVLTPMSAHNLTNPCLTRVRLGNESGFVGDIFVHPDGETIINGSIHRVGDTLKVTLPKTAGASEQPSSAPMPSVLSQKNTNAGAAVLEPALTIPHSDASETFMAELNKLATIRDPAAKGHDVYVFFDPFCKYCHEMYEHTEDFKREGMNPIWIPVATGINPQSPDVAADIMETVKPDERWTKFNTWMTSKGDFKPSTENPKGLELVMLNTQNLAELAEHIPGAGTPLIILPDPNDKEIHIVNGAASPSDIKTIIKG